jgi:hypothetical protein
VLQGELVGLQDRLAQAQGQVVISLIQLYKALGGGWELRFEDFGGRSVKSLEEAAKEKPIPTQPDESDSDPPELLEPPAATFLPDSASEPDGDRVVSLWRRITEDEQQRVRSPAVVPASYESETEQ